VNITPYSLEAEQSILGAVLLENNALLKALELVTAADFYRDSHRRIFRAMLELFDRNEAIDLVTITEHLERKTELEQVGGASYLSALASRVPTAANVVYHSKIVREKALRRRLAEACQKVLKDVETGDMGELVGRLRDISLDANPGGKSHFIGFDAIPEDVEIDFLVEGLIPRGCLILLSAPPGHFKTSFCLSMGQAIAHGQPFMGRTTVQHPVYYIDKENPLVVSVGLRKRFGIGPHQNFHIWPLWAEVEPPTFPSPAYLGLRDCVVIFDSFVRFLSPGADENTTKDIQPVMGYLRGLTSQGCTVIVLDHTAKAADSDYRGSGDKSAGVDIAYRIRRHGEGSRKLSLRCYKSRVFEEFELPFEVIAHPGGGLAFDTAPDRDLEDIEALYDLMAGRTLNQSQIFDLAKDKLGFKYKGRLVHLLKEGEGRRWERTREGNRVLYSPNNCHLSTVSPLKGGDRQTVDVRCSREQKTVGGNRDAKNLKNQQLSDCPGALRQLRQK
jgi:hypothetical protein